MLEIKNPSTNPYYNLALEEYLLKEKGFDDDLFMLWQNKPTIVIGKNQNVYEELNLGYTEKHKIHVARRMSGGGAVYHDLGNLNFTVIRQDGELQKNDFSFFALPVIQCLAYFGVQADFNGRNDILIEGKKFSGNAQYFYRDKVLHHGTILFSSDLNVLSDALLVKKSKIESKGIRSVRSRVTNVSNYLPETVTLRDFSDRLSTILSGGARQKEYRLNQEDVQAVKELQDSKYGTWKWNFGESPRMDMKKEKRYEAGIISVHMQVESGFICGIRFLGDFFEVSSIDRLERHLTGCRYDRAAIEQLLKDEPISRYFLSLKDQEFLELLFT